MLKFDATDTLAHISVPTLVIPGEDDATCLPAASNFMAERILNCNARNGLPLGIRDWPGEIDDPVWTTVAGLMMFSAKLKARDESQQRAAGFLGRMLR